MPAELLDWRLGLQPQSHTICLIMLADSKAWGLRSGCDGLRPGMRVSLTGEVCVEEDGRLLHQRRLLGPPGRHLLTFLAAEHDRAVGHDAELMDAHDAASDTASELAAFARCQIALREALGVGPSPATRERHSALLAQAG